MEPRKILIADGDEEFSRAVTTLLEAEGYQVFGAPDAVAAVSAALRVQPHLIVLDAALPGGGLKTADTMRTLPELDPVPMILLTLAGGNSLVDPALLNGTETFLSKPVDAGFLVRSVGRALGAAGDLRIGSALSSAGTAAPQPLQGARPDEACSRDRFFDETTGLHTRESFLMLTEHQMRVANRTRKGFALVLLKIRNLREITDAYGPLEADHALVRMAQTVRESFRGSDVVAHMGSGEFAVLALETRSAGRDLLTRRLYENLKRFNSETTRRCCVAADAEVVRYDPLHPVPLAELVRWVDAAPGEEVLA